MAKLFRKGLPHSIIDNSRADKRLGRIFLDLGGNTSVALIGGTQYVMILQGDFLRCTWFYFIRNKSDANSAFRRFLADMCTFGTPSEP